MGVGRDENEEGGREGTGRTEREATGRRGTQTLDFLVYKRASYGAELRPGPCSSVGMRRGTDRKTQAHRDTETAVANIHFVSSMPHANCTGNNNV